jgi:hypothetical protein
MLVAAPEDEEAMAFVNDLHDRAWWEVISGRLHVTDRIEVFAARAARD